MGTSIGRMHNELIVMTTVQGTTVSFCREQLDISIHTMNE